MSNSSVTAVACQIEDLQGEGRETLIKAAQAFSVKKRYSNVPTV
jgi:hypothetical protein